MKISVILQALKLLLGVAEEVAIMVTHTKIPSSDQALIHEELNLATSKIESAKSKIAVDPEE